MESVELEPIRCQLINVGHRNRAAKGAGRAKSAVVDQHDEHVGAPWAAAVAQSAGQGSMALLRGVCLRIVRLQLDLRAAMVEPTFAGNWFAN